MWKLLGGGRDQIATYASGALRRGLKLDEALVAARRLREKGHRQTKMQLGLPGVTSPAREVEQARLIREAVGPDMDLMCDINQRWRPEQAIDIGKRVEEAGVGLYWLEDVTAHDDYPGLARVSAALATPVAGGEYLYGIVPFRHMLEARSVDIVMIDQVRSGGITPWLKIAGMAEAFNLPVVSHGVPDIHVHLVGAVPNGLTVEYMPRLFHLWEDVPVPQNGLLAMPSKPGLGLNFSQDAFRHMIEARSVDYVMIDLARVGGVTLWLKVAAMAEAFNLPVVSHVIPEIHTHLVAAAPNGLTVEYMGWMLKLFEGTAEFDAKSGELVLSDRPGLGLDFNQATIDRYAVA